jgi:hypothetical protein
VLVQVPLGDRAAIEDRYACLVQIALYFVAACYARPLKTGEVLGIGITLTLIRCDDACTYVPQTGLPVSIASR